MQQNKAEMQGTQQLSTLRRVSIHTDRAYLHKISDDIIRKYLGVPYKLMGRTEEGLDCYGLILGIYKDIGYELFDISQNYNVDWATKGKNFFYENYYREWDITDAPEPFDVVLFKNQFGIANHGGVLLTQGRLIQTCQQGTIVVRADSEDIKPKIEGFYRLRKRNDNN